MSTKLKKIVKRQQQKLKQKLLLMVPKKLKNIVKQQQKLKQKLLLIVSTKLKKIVKQQQKLKLKLKLIVSTKLKKIVKRQQKLKRKLKRKLLLMLQLVKSKNQLVKLMNQSLDFVLLIHLNVLTVVIQLLQRNLALKRVAVGVKLILLMLLGVSILPLVKRLVSVMLLMMLIRLLVSLLLKMLVLLKLIVVGRKAMMKRFHLATTTDQLTLLLTLTRMPKLLFVSLNQIHGRLLISGLGMAVTTYMVVQTGQVRLLKIWVMDGGVTPSQRVLLLLMLFSTMVSSKIPLRLTILQISLLLLVSN